MTGEPPVLVELPGIAKPVELPRAVLQSNEASALATKIVMTVTWLALGILVLLTLVGPHLPSGE